MTKQDGIKELEELLRDADKAISKTKTIFAGGKVRYLLRLK